MSSRHSGQAYAIRKSPSKETKPPHPVCPHPGQIAAALTSTVATLSGRPVVGQGTRAGLAS
jgi:hypothetical protein